MRTKVWLTVLSVVVLSVFIVVFIAQAGVEPVNAVDSMFSALNSGDIDQISAIIAEDAVARNVLMDRTYNGKEAIGRYLESWHREGRAYDIVHLEMDGDTVNLTVDVSDKGYVWGQQHMKATVNNGLIERLDVLETRLTLWRIRR